MAVLLLGQALFEGFHQLVPAEFLQPGAFGVGQVLLHRPAQPLFGDQHVHPRQRLDPFEVFPESAVKLVEVGFVLDQDSPRQDVEVIETVLDDVLLQRFEQGEEFLDRYGQPARLEVEKEVDQHRRFARRLSGCGGP